jgi:hypothetical protein
VKHDRDTASVMTFRPDGLIEWRNKEGKFHREDGPLGKIWYRNGKRHREDGPAVEHADGKKEWYRQGKELIAAEFAAIREKELAEIGDAFKTGLTREITVSRSRPLKNSS